MAYLLDTNHLGKMLRPDSIVREKMLHCYRQGERFATCWPVLCELEFGIIDTARPERNRQSLNHLLKVVRLWPFDWKIVQLFGTTAKFLQQRGCSLSQVDIMLAAFAQHYSATILTTDKDFDALPDIKTENWLTP